MLSDRQTSALSYYKEAVSLDPNYANPRRKLTSQSPLGRAARDLRVGDRTNDG